MSSGVPPAIVLERLSVGPLTGVSLELGTGLHVVLGSEADGTAELVATLAGSQSARAGTVRIAGADPRRTPELRRRIAALHADEQLFPSRNVLGAVESALAAQRVSAAAADVLQNAGLRAWSQRDPSTLSASERRAVALAIAFSVDAPLLAVLHDPLRYQPGIPAPRVLKAIQAWLERGSSVVCTTSSPRNAHELGGSVWLLDRGQLIRSITSHEAFAFAPGLGATLRVRTEAPRKLAAALTGNDAVSSMIWDESREPFELSVQGTEPEALALALAKTAHDAGIRLQAIVPVLPNLDVTVASSAGFLRAAYERAYRERMVAAERPKASP